MFYKPPPPHELFGLWGGFFYVAEAEKFFKFAVFKYPDLMLLK